MGAAATTGVGGSSVLISATLKLNSTLIDVDVLSRAGAGNAREGAGTGSDIDGGVGIGVGSVVSDAGVVDAAIGTSAGAGLCATVCRIV